MKNTEKKHKAQNRVTLILMRSHLRIAKHTHTGRLIQSELPLRGVNRWF